MKSSSLVSGNVAIQREINSSYDEVKKVASNIDSVVKVSGAVDDGSLAKAAAVVDMEVATGVAGSDAIWDGVTLTIPRGDVGPQGNVGPQGYTPIKGIDYFDGLTPTISFSYNEMTGNLEYTISYVDSPVEIGEW